MTTTECGKVLSAKEMEDFKEAIRYGANYRLYMDGMPSATRYTRKSPEDGQNPLVYSEGIPVGAFLKGNWATPRTD